MMKIMRLHSPKPYPVMPKFSPCQGPSSDNNGFGVGCAVDGEQLAFEIYDF